MIDKLSAKQRMRLEALNQANVTIQAQPELNVHMVAKNYFEFIKGKEEEEESDTAELNEAVEILVDACINIINKVSKYETSDTNLTYSPKEMIEIRSLAYEALQSIGEAE